MKHGGPGVGGKPSRRPHLPWEAQALVRQVRRAALESRLVVVALGHQHETHDLVVVRSPHEAQYFAVRLEGVRKLGNLNLNDTSTTIRWSPRPSTADYRAERTEQGAEGPPRNSQGPADPARKHHLLAILSFSLDFPQLERRRGPGREHDSPGGYGDTPGLSARRRRRGGPAAPTATFMQFRRRPDGIAPPRARDPRTAPVFITQPGERRERDLGSESLSQNGGSFCKITWPPH